MNFSPTVENCPVVFVILISNTAVNTYEKHCDKRHLTIKLEGRISLQFHANKNNMI